MSGMGGGGLFIVLVTGEREEGGEERRAGRSWEMKQLTHKGRCKGCQSMENTPLCGGVQKSHIEPGRHGSRTGQGSSTAGRQRGSMAASAAGRMLLHDRGAVCLSGRHAGICCQVKLLDTPSHTTLHTIHHIPTQSPHKTTYQKFAVISCAGQGENPFPFIKKCKLLKWRL